MTRFLHFTTNRGGGAVFNLKMGRLFQWLPERIDLLTVDVEGAEAGVFRDISPYLHRIRNLFVEWQYCANESGLVRVITQLEETDFACYLQVVQCPSQPFIRKISEV